MKIVKQIITNPHQFILDALHSELKALSDHILQIGDRKICVECLSECGIDETLQHEPDCIAKGENES